MKQLLQDLRSGTTRLEEVPAPRAGAGQVLVRVRASAVSAGTERMLVDFAKSGLLGKARRRPDLVRQALRKARRDGPLAVWEAAQSRLAQPLPLGYSCAGVVEAVGEGVEGFAPGDRAACAGAGYANHAEFVAVPENLCVRVPAEVSFEDAAFTTLGAIALQGFRLSESRLGESVAVIGLGMLGQLSGRIAAAAGCRVFGVDLDADRLAVAREGGFEAAVLRAGAEDAAAAFTGGRGFDCVLIAADGASNDPVELAAALARDRATVVALGNTGLAVPRDPFYRKELTLKVSRSYGPGRYDAAYEEGGLDYPYGYVRWTEKRNLEEFVRLLSIGGVKVAPLVSHRLPIASGVEAYEIVSGTNGHGPSLGILLIYGEDASSSRRVDLKPASPATVGGVSVLGAGQFALGVALPLIARSGAVLRGVVGGSGARAQDAASRFGFAFAGTEEAAVLEDKGTSVVAVFSRHDRHAGQVCAALRAGKSVFVEKPLCLTREELKTIEETLAASAGALSVGFNRRFAPFSRELKAALPAGPKAVSIRINAGPLPSGHWALDPAQGGRLLGEGCHFIDWAGFIVGAAPLTADCRPVGRGSGEQDWSLRLSYADGSIADILYVSGGDPGAGKERYEVHAGGTSAVIDDFRTLSIHAGGRKTARKAWLKADKGHAAQWEAFWGAVSRGEPAPVSWEDIAASTRAALAARESLLSGAPAEVGA